MDTLRWGIDLGGTKIEGVVLQGDEVLFRHRIPTEAAKGYETILDRISLLIDEMSAQVRSRPQSIGIGTPGARDPQTGQMRGCNTTALNGQPMLEDLQTKIGIPIKIANDANCFALAEALLGAGRGYSVVFGVILGTGVGGGIVVDGKVLNGLQGIAGEWGHNELVPGGDPCYCGRKGCVEVVLSGPALERHYAKISGNSIRLPEIVARIDDDIHAENTLKHLYSMFGKAIAPIVNVLDPDAIILGGGVGNVPGLVEEGAKAAKPHIFNPTPQIKLLKPMLGDSAGVFGAALL